jgi:starch-binding outer membrane protein SusE/F
MKKNGYITFLVLTAILGSCTKPKPVYYWQPGSFGDSLLTASVQSVVLSSANDSTHVVSFHWPLAGFGMPASVTYTLQFDTPGDTAGTTPWGNANNVILGTNVDSTSYLGVDLNALASALSLPPVSAGTLLVRVKSAVLQNDGAVSVVPPIYTNVVSIQVTPYALSLYVPGAYQGWSPPTAPLISPFSPAFSFVDEGYVYFAPPGMNSFKYTNAPDWNHINYGDGGNGTLSTNGLANGLTVPDSGYYELTANLKTLTWTATKTVWGILGDATPGGWNTDTKMNYDPVNQVWTVTANMISAGSFKFRANDEWIIDFGVDANGNLAYSDNPIFYNGAINNITVPSDGNYTIMLDLHIAGKYSYHLQKN